MTPKASAERQITDQPHGHILTNTGVWSPDGQWIVYDTRSDPAGAVFDGAHIEMVHYRTGEVRRLYTAQQGAHCGVVTFHPHELKVVFILGPENPTSDWSYGPFHRQGVVVDLRRSRTLCYLDARDLTPPFTAGALRGGSHVHVWHPLGDWVSFTYEDHVLAQPAVPHPDRDINQRNLGVSLPHHPVRVSRDHPRNHDAECFSVLVTRTAAHPKPGSDEIQRACEEGWVGTSGYGKTDGSHQRRALAFQGEVVGANGQVFSEVYVVDLPEDLTMASEAGPLAGTESRLPSPPRGAQQRRLTYTGDQKYPGIQGPRHWLRSSPKGDQIAFLRKDDQGIVQFCLVSPNGGPWRQLTHNPWSIASAFTWSPDGQRLAHVMDGSVCLTDVRSGQTTRLTVPGEEAAAPRPEACVFSPDGKHLAYVRRPAGHSSSLRFNQIYLTSIP